LLPAAKEKGEGGRPNFRRRASPSHANRGKKKEKKEACLVGGVDRRREPTSSPKLIGEEEKEKKKKKGTLKKIEDTVPLRTVKSEKKRKKGRVNHFHTCPPKRGLFFSTQGRKGRKKKKWLPNLPETEKNRLSPRTRSGKIHRAAKEKKKKRKKENRVENRTSGLGDRRKKKRGEVTIYAARKRTATKRV